MQPYRADRVVRVLTAIVSVAYFTVMVGAAAALIAIPVARATIGTEDRRTSGENERWTLGWPMSITARDPQSTVQTAWGPARFVVEETSVDLRFPIEQLPWRVVAVLWLFVAVAMGLLVLTLYHLRRIFQRVRDGAPFDGQNALRLRTVGLLLLAAGGYNFVVELVVSLALRRAVVTGDFTVPVETNVDVPMIFVALGLVALAEVFRRGAELEDEQSLVV